MIAIRASEGEVDISGTVEELLEVGLTIRALASSPQTSVSVAAARCCPTPYDDSISCLLIYRRQGRTLVSLTSSGLEVSGSDKSLKIFASWFELPAGVSDGYHQHFEPLVDDPDHSSDSVPLVITVRQGGP